MQYVYKCASCGAYHSFCDMKDAGDCAECGGTLEYCYAEYPASETPTKEDEDGE